MKCQLAFQKGSDLQPHHRGGCLKRQPGFFGQLSVGFLVFVLVGNAGSEECPAWGGGRIYPPQPCTPCFSAGIFCPQGFVFSINFHSDYPKWAIWELVFTFVFQLQVLGCFLLKDLYFL